MDKPIERVWAYVTIDDGAECVMTLQTDQGIVPMIGEDKETCASIAEHAQAAADSEGWTVHLIEFTGRRHVRTFTPHKKPAKKMRKGEQ